MGIEFEKRIDVEVKPLDIIASMKDETSPIYVYGAGLGAQKVIKLCMENEIEIMAAFVDSPYYQSGMTVNESVPVLDIKDVMRIGQPDEAIAVVMGMKNMRAGYELKKKYSCVKQIYYMADLASEVEFKVTKDFYIEHKEQFSHVYESLVDEESKNVFVAWVNGCLSKDVTKIFDLCERKRTYFSNGIFEVVGDVSYIDVGAYIGDTIEEYLLVNPKVREIYAFEGESEFCDVMRDKFLPLQNEIHIEIFSSVLWSENASVVYEASKTDSYVGKCVRLVSKDEGEMQGAVTLDEVMLSRDVEQIDLLKINVIGSGYVLAGAKTILEKHHPKIAMKVGWTGFENICKIVEILELYNYEIYMRFNDSRLEELTIYAI